MTQDILSDMTDDEVNSIDDTFASQQVASIIRSTYEAMMSNRNWPHTRKLVQVYPYSSQDQPTHMVLQQEIKELCFINYNIAPLDSNRFDFVEMVWKEPDDFLRMLNTRDSSKENIRTIYDRSGVVLLITTDRHPKYYTSFDDNTLVFDSYDVTVDSTLQESKIQAMAYISPLWQHNDSFIPDLPVEAFPALINEAKSTAMFRLKQTQDFKAEKESIKQQRWLSRKAWRVNGGIQYPNYGRKGRR